MSVMAEQRIVGQPSPLDDLWPDDDRPLTVDDLLRQPGDGNRYELVDGILEVTPAAKTPHQRVVSRLHTLLDVACPDGFEVLNGPGINLAVDLHRVPDVAVFSAAPAVAGFITRPPVLAIEVASRSTRKRDRTAKKSNYASFGIDLYWIVEPDAGRPSLTAYELRGKKYEQVALAAGDELYEPERPYAVSIVPRLLIADGREWRSLMR
jgi:Uma2 family endonuclease